jgi:hypothetical protein
MNAAPQVDPQAVPQAALVAPPIDSAADAQAVIAHLEGIMDSLLAAVEEETALVRAGRLHDATALEASKSGLARAYMLESERIKNSKTFLTQALPAALDALRERHDLFYALLQINMTVLATAHAVSEGIVRGVSSELTRKTSPSTYGAGGRTNAPGPRAMQPIAISRSL